MTAINLILLSLVLALGSPLASANLLTNAGFEDPIMYDFLDTTTWQGFASDGQVNSAPFNSTSNPRSGAQSAEMHIFGDDLFAGIAQDVGGLTVGQGVNFSGWAASERDPGGVEIRIEWLDGLKGNEISRSGNLVPALTDVYSMFSFDSSVPFGANTARLIFVVQSLSAGPQQVVFLDDASFTVSRVSEPTTLSLFGITALILAGLRRRVHLADRPL